MWSNPGSNDEGGDAYAKSSLETMRPESSKVLSRQHGWKERDTLQFKPLGERTRLKEKQQDPLKMGFSHQVLGCYLLGTGKSRSQEPVTCVDRPCKGSLPPLSFQKSFCLAPAPRQAWAPASCPRLAGERGWSLLLWLPGRELRPEPTEDSSGPSAGRLPSRQHSVL